MKKALFKNPFFYLALLAFILALIFHSPESYVGRLVNTFLFFTYLVSVYKLKKAIRKKSSGEK